MKDFVKKDFEKFLLTLMLAGLAIAAVIVIFFFDMERINLKGVDKAAGAGIDFPAPVTVEAKLTTERLRASQTRPFDSDGFIYCRKPECNYLLNKEQSKCPWCDTTTDERPQTGGKTADTDGDGLPDALEVQHNLDPQDPNDAAKDEDGDGFTNIEEITYEPSTDIRDGASHPSLLNKTMFVRTKTEFAPIRLKEVTVGDEKKKETWDIYGDELKSRRWTSFFAKVNQKVGAYHIVDVGVDKSENGKDTGWIIVKKGEEEPFKVTEGERAKPKDAFKIHLGTLLAGKPQLHVLLVGQTFTIKNLKGIESKYKLQSYSDKDNSVVIQDFSEGNRFTIGKIMKMPDAK